MASITRPEAICTCTGNPPWPAMMRLHVDGLNRYYVCLECGTIREEICESEGTIAYVRIYEAGSEELPAVVVEQVRLS